MLRGRDIQVINAINKFGHSKHFGQERTLCRGPLLLTLNQALPMHYSLQALTHLSDLLITQYLA